MPRKNPPPPKPCEKCGIKPKVRAKGARYCEDCSTHCDEHKSQKLGCNRCRKAVSDRDRHTPRFKEIQGRSYRRRKYGLTDDELDDVLAIEECEVCGSTDRLVIDHNHASGTYRGVLCNGCNTALGHAGDSIDTLLGLVAYLRERGSYGT